MYDIKSTEIGEKKAADNYLTSYCHEQTKNENNIEISNNLIDCNSISSTVPEQNKINAINLSLRRRRIFQRQTCLISIMIAFAFGLTLGVFVPMIGMPSAFTSTDHLIQNNHKNQNQNKSLILIPSITQLNDKSNNNQLRNVSDFPKIYELGHQGDDQNSNQNKKQQSANTFRVSFINKVENKELPVEEVFRNAYNLEQDKSSDDTMIVKKLEYLVKRTNYGMFRKGAERRVSKPSVAEQVLSSDMKIYNNDDEYQIKKSLKSSSSVHFVAMKSKHLNIINQYSNFNSKNNYIKNDIYWGDIIENAIPNGFKKIDSDQWNHYIKTNPVIRLEDGCGRMQNRLITFADGTRACVRYRQNTDQIQGELFSFYLGQLLNITNLAPSAASVIDLKSLTWSQAITDIQLSEWKATRPVVLTKWLPNLEPAGIPTAFKPLERHLNKYDVFNITLSLLNIESILKQEKQVKEEKQLHKRNEQVNINYDKNNSKGLLELMGAIKYINNNNQSLNRSIDFNITNGSYKNKIKSQYTTVNYIDNISNTIILNRLIELAQWSDLIVFDYLIANLDRVVNNLYNFQWNLDIMYAPAHNLAKQIHTQLLVFLDNESGLLHGYRLLKKYEAYHGLLLDHLCVFRQSTIKSLINLRDYGAGHQLQELFEQSTTTQVRDVLPSLPDKSIKILNYRIGRILGQVQKCRDLFSDR